MRRFFWFELAQGIPGPDGELPRTPVQMFEVAREINYRKVRHPEQLIPDIVALVHSEKQVVEHLTNKYQHARHALDAEVAVAKKAEEIRLRTGEDLAAV